MDVGANLVRRQCNTFLHPQSGNNKTCEIDELQVCVLPVSDNDVPKRKILRRAFKSAGKIASSGQEERFSTSLAPAIVILAEAVKLLSAAKAVGI